MILVVGATGTLGGVVARELLPRDERVRVLVRPGSDYAGLEAAGAEPVTGDLKDPASLARACGGITTVVTTANSARRGGDDTVDAVDRSGNRALIDAAHAAGVGHFIFVSALGSNEDSPVDFFRAKAEAERHLRESGLRYTILQPNIFMEVWIGMIVGMPVQQGRAITLVGSGERRHSFVAQRDVATYGVACVSNPAALDRTLVIAGPEALSWMDVVRAAEGVLGRPLEVRHIAPGEQIPGLPEVVAHLAAALDSYETVIDGRPLAAEFGVPLMTVEQYLRGTLAVAPPMRTAMP